MTPEERSELASLHALSLLEGANALLAARLVESDPAFAAEVDSYSAAIATFAESYAPVEPSETARQRILSIAKKPVRQTSGGHWIGWAAAAVLALISGLLFLQRDQAIKVLRRATTENTRLAGQLAALEQQSGLANVRIASLESKLREFDATRAIVVWDESNHNGLIRLTGLPAAGEGKDYQLWVVDPTKTSAVNAGLIHRFENGTASVSFKPDQKIDRASAFAISVEKTGGVKVAEGPIVLVGE